MTVATSSVPAHIRKDLSATLHRLRQARIVHPDHEQPPPNRYHGRCEVCRNQRRLDWLIDQIPRSNP